MSKIITSGLIRSDLIMVPAISFVIPAIKKSSFLDKTARILLHSFSFPEETSMLIVFSVNSFMFLSQRYNYGTNEYIGSQVKSFFLSKNYTISQY